MRTVHRFIAPAPLGEELSVPAEQLPMETPFRISDSFVIVKRDLLTDEPVLLFTHMLAVEGS